VHCLPHPAVVDEARSCRVEKHCCGEPGPAEEGRQSRLSRSGGRPVGASVGTIPRPRRRHLAVGRRLARGDVPVVAVTCDPPERGGRNWGPLSAVGLRVGSRCWGQASWTVDCTHLSLDELAGMVESGHRLNARKRALPACSMPQMLGCSREARRPGCRRDHRQLTPRCAWRRCGCRLRGW